MPNFYNILRARKFTTVADTAVEISAHDSATPNFVIEAGGKLKWSSGSQNADTTLYRSAANTLKTDDSFDIAAGHTYKIDGDDVLTSTSLGSTVVNSSLTSLGNLVSLNAATPSFVGPTTIDGSLTVTGTLIASNFEGGGGGGGALYTEVIGNNTGSVFIINHNLGTRDVFVSFRENGDNYENLNVAWEATSEDSITVNFGTPPALNSVKVLVYGSVSGTPVTISTLDDIEDVIITSATPNQFLKFDGSDWVNTPVNAGTGVTISHDPTTISIGQSVGVTDSVIFDNVNVSTNITLLEGGTITTSNPSAVTAGSITIQPQGIMGSDPAMVGGNVNIYAGYAFGTFAIGGQVQIDAGQSVLPQPNGSVSIGNSYAEQIYIGRSGKTTTIYGNLTVDGTLSFQQTTEKVNTSSISSNVMTCDYTTGAIYYQSTNPSANFTVNFTNVPTTNNKAITFTVFVTQGATGYIPSALQIDGSAQTIKWAQGTQPTPTANKIDIFSFTLIRLSSSWTVFGNANTNF